MGKHAASCFDDIPPVDDDSGLFNVIIETPKGSGCKNRYDPDLGVFRITKSLPVGLHFPYDFGYIPGTLAEDGDPLDVLVIANYPTFVGGVVAVQLIGVLEAEQTEKDSNTLKRNDRLIGCMALENNQPQVNSVKDMEEKFLNELQKFFVYYNALEKKKFTPLDWHGPKRADKLVEKGIQACRKQRHKAA